MPTQATLFGEVEAPDAITDGASSTFVKNMSLPVHRWFRYSAGFSATWVQSVLRAEQLEHGGRVFDPFAGSATTLIAAERAGIAAAGADSHPFVARIARAKLQWRSDPQAYLIMTKSWIDVAATLKPDLDVFPSLIRKCYDDDALLELDRLRRGLALVQDDTPAWELAWLTLVAILRKVSTAGTAQWQYILPKKRKRNPLSPAQALLECRRMIAADMELGRSVSGPRARFYELDARECDGLPDDYADLVITSPPYPNNYDYADATRLEMSFLLEVDGWGCLQEKVRRHLVRSCSQHVPEKAVDLTTVLAREELAPIRAELTAVCNELAAVRETKGGKKTYHLMIACYFADLARVWLALRRVCRSPSKVCFVIGDSAPYAVYVPVIPWMGALAVAAGFKSYTFEKTRDRNTKWKNRKHRVPLLEGRLWVKG